MSVVLTDKQKEEEARSIQKRYGKRRGFKSLFKKAQRELYKVDILQPFQREFRDHFRNSYVAKQATDKNVERLDKERVDRVDEAYRKSQRGVTTLEQKTLKELKAEHPKMINDEDIITWETK